MSATIVDLCARLRALPVAIVSDVMTHAGLPDRVVSASLRPLREWPRFAGPAVCFSGAAGPTPTTPAGRSRLIYEADRRITQGNVVVFATGGFRTTAVLGGNTLAGWRKRGCAGVVCDGMARDLAELTDMPVYAAGLSPISTGNYWSYRSLELPAVLPGQTVPSVTVEPGDIVHGDADGVIILPAVYLADIVRDAEITAQVERRIQADIEAGLDRGDSYLSNDRFGHVRRHPAR